MLLCLLNFTPDLRARGLGALAQPQHSPAPWLSKSTPSLHLSFPVFLHTHAHFLVSQALDEEGMDPVSVGAGIIAVIQVTDRVAQLCRYYIGAVDDYPKDLRSILIETSTLTALLENIEFLIDSDGGSSPMLKSLGGEEGPIAGCQRTISELELLFPAASANTTQEAKRKRVKATLAQLAWPFRQEKARVLLAQLVQHKTTINTAVSSETL